MIYNTGLFAFLPRLLCLNFARSMIKNNHGGLRALGYSLEALRVDAFTLDIMPSIEDYNLFSSVGVARAGEAFHHSSHTSAVEDSLALATWKCCCLEHNSTRVVLAHVKIDVCAHSLVFSFHVSSLESSTHDFLLGSRSGCTGGFKEALFLLP